MLQEPEIQVKEYLLLEELSKCGTMRGDLEYYERCEITHPDHSYEWLLKRAKFHINRKRQLANREATCQSFSGKSYASPASVAPAAEAKKGKGGWKPRGNSPGSGSNRGSSPKGKGKGVCFRFRDTGKCDTKDCPYSHVRSQSPGHFGSRGGSREGSPGRSRSFSPSRSSNAKPVCRFWAKDGRCNKGDKCKFSHERSRSPSPVSPAAKSPGKTKQTEKTRGRSPSRSSSGRADSPKRGRSPVKGSAAVVMIDSNTCHVRDASPVNDAASNLPSRKVRFGHTARFEFFVEPELCCCT